MFLRDECMSIKVNVHDAKTHFSRYLDRVKNGEEIIIAKAGKPVARLTPIKERGRNRVPGSAKGRVAVSEDFDASLPESVLGEFEG